MTKTILMIHGFGAAGDSWAPVAASFAAAGYAVETPTIHAALRTVGPPPAGLAGKTLADYVAEMSDLAKALAKRDGAAPVVFGHSMGGLIAQKLAEAGLASGLVLFAPASPADARGKPKLSPVFTFLNIVLAGKPETKAVKIWKTGFKWGVLNQTPADRHDAIFATTVHDSGRALSDLAYPDRDPGRTVHVDAAKVTVPVLVLAGTRDRTTPIEDLRLVGQKYAGATFREYPDNAHWLVDEPGSAEILAEVKTWLDAQGLGAAAPAAKAAPAEKPAKVEAAKPAVPVTPAIAPVAAKPTPKPTAKPAAKAKAAPAEKPAKAEAVKPAAAKPAAKAKAAPKPKVAPVKAAPAPTPAPAAKAPAKAKAAPAAAAKAKPVAKPAAKAPPSPKAKAAPKVAPKVSAAPKVAKAVPAPAPVAAAKPKAAAKPAVAPAVTKAPAKPVPVARPKAKPIAKTAPATKAPARAKPAPAAKPVAAKAPAAPKAAAKASATKSTAKSSPAPKKSV